MESERGRERERTSLAIISHLVAREILLHFASAASGFPLSLSPSSSLSLLFALLLSLYLVSSIPRKLNDNGPREFTSA